MGRSTERAQSLVELVGVVPMCVLCALALVDAGVLVRDRVATVQAGGRAATATLSGSDARVAALGALPEGLRGTAVVRVEGDAVTVSTTSRPALLRLPGGVDHRSTVRLDEAGEGGQR